jgi:hypothetical protein
MDDWWDIEAIKQLKARYFRFLDTKQWESWRGLFTDDAVVKVHAAVTTWGGEPDIKQVFRGAEDIMTSVRAIVHDSVTVHHGHMPEIELTSATTARGVWAMEDIVDTAQARFRGHGHYHETYRKTDGDWRIASLELTRLRLERHEITPPRG